MKVLILPPGVLPIPAYKGGAVEALIESYIKYNEIKHENDFTIYTIKDDNECYKKYKHTKFIQVDTNSIFYKAEKLFRYFVNNKLPKIHIGNAYITKVIRMLKKAKEQYDIIIVENCPFYILKLRKLYPNTKIICHLHNDYLNKDTKYAKKILNQYDKILTVSDYIKRKVQEIDKSIQSNKIETVYNGVNTDIFNQKIENKKIENYRKKYNLNKDDIIFLYTGRLVKEKGVKELILAFNKLLKNSTNKKIKLLIVRKQSK